jgi:nucleoid DNA-binding protein
MTYKTTPIIHHQGLKLRVVGTFKINNRWEHDVVNLETGEVKRKSDEWLTKVKSLNNHLSDS